MVTTPHASGQGLVAHPDEPRLHWLLAWVPASRWDGFRAVQPTATERVCRPTREGVYRLSEQTGRWPSCRPWHVEHSDRRGKASVINRLTSVRGLPLCWRVRTGISSM